MADTLAPEIAAQLRPGRTRCVVGEGCEGALERLSEQGQGLCARHATTLREKGEIRLSPYLSLAYRPPCQHERRRKAITQRGYEVCEACGEMLPTEARR